MKMVLTAKLKLHTTPAQFQALRATQLAYRDSLNFVSQYAFVHGKMSNRVALQEGTYVSPTLTYQYKKDYSFKAKQQISILTLEGRVILPYTGYEKHVALIQKDAEIGTATLWYDKAKKRFYLLVSLEIGVASPTPATHTSVV